MTATLEGGSGGMWFHWEGNNAGAATGDGGATFVIDTSVPGDYWLRAVGGSDGTDGDYTGKIRFRVAGDGAAFPRRAGREIQAGETLVWSEDFAGMTSGSSTVIDYNGWTGDKCYNINNSVRVGSSNGGGYVTSPSGTLDGEAGRLEFSMWRYDSGAAAMLQRSVDGGANWIDLATYSSADITAAAQVFSVDVPASQTVMFKWANDAGKKRFYLDDVALYTVSAEPEENQPPVLDLDPDVEAVEVFLGQECEIEVAATDYDGDAITLSASGEPVTADTWEAENGTGSATGYFIWTPQTTGTWNVVFSAADKDGTTNRTVAITVVPEGPGTLAFDSDGVHVRESAGAVTLTVERTGGAAGAVTVAWATADGTASAGSEYVAGGGALAFADGQTEATLSVALLDDTSAEENKSFSVVLGNVTGGASLGDATTCTVTIVDDDDANASYYASCYKNGVLKTGSELKDALCKILNTGVKTNSYGSGLDTILQVTDRNSTNGNSSQVRCLYLQSGITAFNKEHIWAQSHGIDGSGPAYSDLHHIRACNSTMNSTRGDKDFDNRRNVSGATEVNGCWYTSKAWEPPDAAKGDVARAVLYMDVRYENKYNGKVDLETVDSIGTSTVGNQLGKLSTLIAWNELDPPDDFEKRRNELIYTTYQYNRNPFIDHPTWVRAVFDPTNFTEEAITWTVNVTAEGDGWVNNQTPPLSLEVTNGLTKTFYVVPNLFGHWHIGSISWNGTLVPQAYYTNASYYNYTCPVVTNNSTLAVVFAADKAALGTPVWWLAQYGGNEASVAQEDWDAAELEDWNDDGVPNWQEYVNGTDPTALSLRQVENVAVTAVDAEGFTLGWDAVDYADYYKVRVCSTAVTEAASAGFEGGSLDGGWSTNNMGTAVATNYALAGSYGMAFSTNGAWLCSPAVENPAAVEFLYKRSGNNDSWSLAVEVSENGGSSWTTADTITNATTSVKTASIDLSAWYGKTVRVRLRDARESGAAARYVDAVKVYAGGAAVAEGTSATTSWTATGLESGTTYGAMVCAVATTLGSATGKWSTVVSATTASGDGRTAQTITFQQIADQVATNTVALGATASSGLPVAYVVAGNAVESGGVLSFTGDGSVTVTASQEGNAEYAPAASVSRTFNVTKAEQTIAWGEIDDQVETSTVVLSATATSSGAVEFVVTSGNAEINGNTLSFTGTGEVTVSASQAGGLLWESATVSQTFSVNAVALGVPADIWASATNSTGFTAAWSTVDGATGYELSVWTGSGGETTWTTNETVVLSNDFATITGNGNIKLNDGAIAGWTFVNAYGATNEIRMGASSATGQVVTASVAVEGTLRVVAWARPWGGDTSDLWIEVNGTAVSNELTATSKAITNEFAGLAGNYTIMFYTTSGNKHRVFLESVVATEVVVTEDTTSGIVPVPGYDALAVPGTSQLVTGLEPETTYSFHTRATAGSATGAWSATEEVTTWAEGGGKSPQTITFGEIADQVVGATVTLEGSASSGLAVSYAVSGPASLAGNVLTCTGEGTVTVTASQAGNDSYEAAADVIRTFTVSKVAQSITFDAISDQEVGATVMLGATASSGLTVSYAVSGPTTLNGNVLTCMGEGTVRVTASQAGNATYAAASDVERTFEVSKVSVELPAPADVWTSATNAAGFTAAWSPVAGAEGYELSVWTEGGMQTVFTTNETTLFSTNFASIQGSGNTLLNNNSIAGWSFGNTYSLTNEIRVGASKVAGAVTSATYNVSGSLRIVTAARRWSANDTNEMWVAISTGAVQTNDVSVTSSIFTNIFDGVDGEVSVSWYNTAGRSRFILEAVDIIEETVTEEEVAGGSVPVPGYEARAVDGTTCEVTGLTAATEYGFKVRAVAGEASSVWSADSTVTTKQAQSIAFEPIANQTVGATLTLEATADSELPVTFAVTGPATLTGNVLTCTSAGTVTVTASQNGNDFFEAAMPVVQSFAVSLVPQTITFNTIGNRVTTDIVTLSATASSGLDVTFAVTSGPAEVYGATLAFTGAGEVTVTASQAGNDTYASASASQTFTVTKATQSIDFPAISGQSVGDTVALNATASSGLPVSYNVSGPATLAGNVLTCTGAGTVTVTASQVGNDIYEAATSIARSFEVSLVPQTIAFTTIGNQTATDTVTLSATASSGLDVTFVVTSGPAVLNGSTLTFTGAGEVTVTASQAGNATYASASASQMFTVTKATQSIDFTAIEGQSVGDTMTLNATASSGLVVSYNVSGPASLEGNLLTCTGAGTVTVTASQAGNDIYEAATSVERSFEVSLVIQSIDFTTIGDQTAIATVTLSATASSGLDVTFAVTSGPAEVNGSTLTFTGAGEVTVTASQAGNDIYASASESQTFSVTKATQSIDFPAISGQSVGNTVTLNATASSGLAVSYTVSGPATLDGTTLSFTDAGTVTVTASQSGSAIWAAAADMVQTFEVSLLTQTIDFPVIPDQVTTNTVTLSATATSGLGVTFAVTSGPATLDGNTLTFTSAGTVVVTASQAGGGNYTAAADVSWEFEVTKAVAEVTLGGLSQTYDGESKSVTVTTEPEGLLVAVTYNGRAEPPTAVGSYVVSATVEDTIWEGIATGALVIGKASHRIEFAEIGEQIATNTVALSATASSGLEVTFDVTSGPAVLEGNVLSFTGSGTVVVAASQAGNESYEATSVSQTFVVSKAMAEVTLGGLLQTYDGEPKSVTVITEPAGLSVWVTYDGSTDPPSPVGSYAVSATVEDAIWAGSADGVLVVAKGAQTIEFSEIAGQIATNVVTLETVASSGLAVSYAVEGPGALEGNVLSFTGAGTVSVTASQSGDANWETAEDVTRMFEVSKAVAKVALGGLEQVYDGETHGVTVATDPEGLSVVVTYDESGEEPVGAGSYVVSAVVEDAIWAGSSEGTLVIGKASQSIVFATIGDQITTNTVVLSATASSGLAVTFEVTSGPAVLEGNVLSFTGSGTVVVTASQAGDANWEAAEEVMRTFEVAEPEPEKSAYEVWLEGHGLNAEDYPAELDWDEDGMSNWAEYVANTDPTNKAVFFAISEGSMVGDTLTLIPSPVSPERVYSVVYWTNMLASPQTNVLGSGFDSLSIETNVPTTWFGTIRVGLP